MNLKKSITFLNNIKQTIINKKKTLNKDKITLSLGDYTVESIETVLQELSRLQEDNKNLRDYLWSQGMVSNYIRYKKSKK